MVKNKLNKNWLYDYINDFYVKLVQKEGYCVCVVYKFKEIDEEECFIKFGQVIVDFGCIFGSWCQYVCNKLVGVEGGGIYGIIIGLDILLMDLIVDVYYIQGDFCEDELVCQLEVLLQGCKVDFVLLDMVFNLLGVVIVDVVWVEYLIDLVIDFVQLYMKFGGVLLVKCFNGIGYNELVYKFWVEFKMVMLKKFKVSCDKLFEIFLLGKILKNFCS